MLKEDEEDFNVRIEFFKALYKMGLCNDMVIKMLIKLDSISDKLDSWENND